MSVEAKLDELGLVLPAPPKLPPGLVLPFRPVKVRDDMAYVSGHIALMADGSLLQPLGRVGADLSSEQGVEAARATALAMLSSLRQTLGDLERIETWVSVFGMVNASADFYDFPTVINGFSTLVLELFGEEAGSHSRSAIGVGGLPFNTPVEVEAVLALKS